MMKKLKKALLAVHRDEGGAMSVEKILILAVISLPILILLFAFRNTIMDWFKTNAGQLNNN